MALPEMLPSLVLRATFAASRLACIFSSKILRNDAYNSPVSPDCTLPGRTTVELTSTSWQLCLLYKLWTAEYSPIKALLCSYTYFLLYGSRRGTEIAPLVSGGNVARISIAFGPHFLPLRSL